MARRQQVRWRVDRRETARHRDDAVPGRPPQEPADVHRRTWDVRTHAFWLLLLFLG